MTIKELFEKTATMNQVLKVVEKRFAVMIDFNDGNCYEFPRYHDFVRFVMNEYVKPFQVALMNATFDWDKPIVKVPLAYIFIGYIQEQEISITLCEHDCK